MPGLLLRVAGRLRLWGFAPADLPCPGDDLLADLRRSLPSARVTVTDLPPATRPAAREVRFEVPAEPMFVGVLRARLREWLSSGGLDGQASFELVLACSEAAAAAVESTAGELGHALEVHARQAAGRVTVGIRTAGPRQVGMLPDPASLRETLLRSYGDEISFISSETAAYISIARQTDLQREVNPGTSSRCPGGGISSRSVVEGDRRGRPAIPG